MSRLIPKLSKSSILEGYGLAYQNKIKDLFRSSVIAYWILNESSGTYAYDTSGYNFHGLYVGNVSLGQEGIEDNNTSVYFTNSLSCRLDLSNSGVHTLMNFSEGTLCFWSKPNNASQWTDGVGKYILYIQPSVTNNIFIIKMPASNTIRLSMQEAGVSRGFVDKVVTPLPESGWIHIGVTWSAISGIATLYYNGSAVVSTLTWAGLWSSTSFPTTTFVLGQQGSSGTGDGFKHTHYMILNRSASPTEMSKIYNYAI